MSKTTSAPQSPPTLFVETTVPIDLIIGEGKLRAALRTLLNGYDVRSSTYVLMEFHRTMVHAMRAVRSFADEAPSDPGLFPFILRRIRNTPFHSERISGRCVDFTASLMERYQELPIRRREVIDYIDALLDLVYDLTWLGILVTTNATDCDLVRPDRPQGQAWLSRTSAKRMTCNRDKAKCMLDAFITRHQRMLPSIAETCQGDAAYDDKNALKTLQRILTTQRPTATGQGRCWYLGDIIMALEAIGVGALLSSNTKHYRPICDALNIAFVPYPQV